MFGLDAEVGEGRIGDSRLDAKLTGRGLGRRVQGETRLDGEPAARDAGGHHGELQGGDGDIALADAGNQCFTALPGRPQDLLFPGAGRDQARLFTGQIRQQGLSEAQALGHRGDAVDAHPLGHFVEKDVARPFHTVAQGDPAVAFLLPAVEAGGAELDRTAAIEIRIRADHAGIQRRQRHGYLKGRSRGILPGNGLVDQRRHRVLRQPTPFLRRQAAVEGIGVEGRLRSHGQDLTGTDIENDAGRAFRG